MPPRRRVQHPECMPEPANSLMQSAVRSLRRRRAPHTVGGVCVEPAPCGGRGCRLVVGARRATVVGIYHHPGQRPKRRRLAQMGADKSACARRWPCTIPAVAGPGRHGPPARSCLARCAAPPRTSSGSGSAATVRREYRIGGCATAAAQPPIPCSLLGVRSKGAQAVMRSAQRCHLQWSGLGVVVVGAASGRVVGIYHLLSSRCPSLHTAMTQPRARWQQSADARGDDHTDGDDCATTSPAARLSAA